MMTGAEPKPPLFDGGMWVACMLDEHGCEWPTGRVWMTEEDARKDGEITAAEWNQPKPHARPFWAFWRVSKRHQN